MNMTEKNGQPSMEEILASIRRIIAEEPASQAHGDFRGGQPIMLKGDGVLDDAGDFDLPAIFRSSPAAAQDRPAPLLGRLTDAIRGAAAAPPDEAADGEGATLDDAVTGEPIHDYTGLSSLKTVRTHDAHAGEGAALDGSMNGSAAAGAVNGSGIINGHGHYGGSPAAAPVQAASSSGDDEPKRQMAPFKDTKFLRMSGPEPAASSAPEPAPVPPVAVAPVPVEMPVAPVEPEAVQPMPDVSMVPPAMASPPPPLPTEALGGDASAEGMGSIEDTTADLLRPMLRQWLADNMPRMVEKALHIEIAESVKPPKKP